MTETGGLVEPPAHDSTCGHWYGAHCRAQSWRGHGAVVASARRLLHGCWRRFNPPSLFTQGEHESDHVPTVQHEVQGPCEGW